MAESKETAPVPIQTSSAIDQYEMGSYSNLGHQGSLEIASGSRTRKDSSSLSHDEALNISRAGLSPPKSSTSFSRRPRSNSKYDRLGLLAAYSGGPSSF